MFEAISRQIGVVQRLLPSAAVVKGAILSTREQYFERTHRASITSQQEGSWAVEVLDRHTLG